MAPREPPRNLLQKDVESKSGVHLVGFKSEFTIEW